MKKTYNKLTCLFGHHDYSKRLTEDKYGFNVYFCKHCKRSGYYKWSGTVETRIYCDYNEDGNLVCKKWGNGIETWFEHDEEGNLIDDDECPREYDYY